MPKEADTDKGNWRNWNYICYMRLEVRLRLRK